MNIHEQQVRPVIRAILSIPIDHRCKECIFIQNRKGMDFFGKLRGHLVT
jgi:hypothetical protein